MALATTTNSAAIAVGDYFITVAAATSIAAGRFVVINDEIMQVTTAYVTASLTVPVLRGLNGSYQKAHVSGCNVTHGLPSDFSANAIPATTVMPLIRPVRCIQYTAAGAIAMPLQGEDLRVNINGGTARAMTLAAPTKDLDFCRLTITSSGTTDANAAAHTVTVANGLGGAGSGYTVLTFDANGTNGLELQAQNGKWAALNVMDGTLTKAATSLA